MIEMPRMSCKYRMVYFFHFLMFIFYRPENGDPEDLWDFGTVRHGGRPNTIGRAHNSVRATGPPLTWENNGSAPPRHDERSRSPSRRVSASSFSSSITTKGELPPLPPSASSGRFQQSTVRHAPPPEQGTSPKKSPTAPIAPRREPSDEYEDYDDQYVDTYSSAKSSMLHQKMQDVHIDDDLPDTTMLDSVILPAIASVST